MPKKVLAPQPGPQRQFLSTKADICIYGGAAGGGKSYGLLMEPLRHINNPRFGAVIFRQSFTQIMEEGALWDTAEEIYPYLGASPKKASLDWIFQSGAKVGFAHLSSDADKHKYQGSQIPLICCEETTPIILGDGTTKPVGEIQESDRVLTLEGDRPVIWRGQRRLENCVEVTVYNAAGQLVGKQIQSDTHRMLTPSGWLSYADIVGQNYPLAEALPVLKNVPLRLHLPLQESSLKQKSQSPQQYTHPYRSDVRQASLSLEFGSCDITPCSQRWVVDLTVSEVSHYLTTTGLVNQNCFDELTHFQESSVFYLLSRNRSTCGIRPYVRATTNPDSESWIASFIEWWIGEDGLIVPERSGVVRWFMRQSGEVIWADTPEQITDRYPEAIPKSFTFVRSTIKDNKILMNADPGYLANLQSLHPIDQARLLYGNWVIKPESGKVFNRTWFEVVDSVPTGGVEVRFWDLAATEASMNSKSCYTAGVKMRLVNGIYYVLDVIAERVGPANADALIQNTAAQDGRFCKVRWELEGGSAGIRDEVHIRGFLRGYDAKGIPPMGDKVRRAKPLATDCYHPTDYRLGKVKLLRAPWNDQYLSWMHEFPDGAIKDVTDASSGAHAALTENAPKSSFGTYNT